MATVHFILQGKGGVAKSLVASFLFQHLRSLGIPVVGVDTDPVNRTFAGYKEFDITELEIMKNGDIDSRKFDLIIETVIDLPKDTHIVVDNGASSFIKLCDYLKTNGALSVLQEEGHEVRFHSVITGGQAINDTLSNLKNLAVDFPEIPLVVWLNLYFGDIVIKGKSFDNMKIYLDHSHQFQAIIQIPNLKKETYGKDVEDLLASRASFEAGINSSLPIMTRQRLKIFWTKTQEVMTNANLAD